jgi:hypothetical protein
MFRCPFCVFLYSKDYSMEVFNIYLLYTRQNCLSVPLSPIASYKSFLHVYDMSGGPFGESQSLPSIYTSTSTSKLANMAVVHVTTLKNPNR